MGTASGQSPAGGPPSYDGDGIWSNDFYGGDLAGIRKKLDYLKSLGVKTLYLIFEATSNHKYDTADYERIDRMFGTNEEFELLAREAKKRGMHLVLDGVFNHVGDDSKYFDRYGKWSDPEQRPQEIGAWWAWKLKKEGKWQESYASPWESWFKIHDDDSYEGWRGFDSLPVIRAPEGSELNVNTFADYILRRTIPSPDGGSGRGRAVGGWMWLRKWPITSGKPRAPI